MSGPGEAVGGLEPPLDRFARPLTGAFEWARDADPRPHLLSAAQTAAFERDGFVTGVRVLDETRVALLAERLERIARDLERLSPWLYEVEAAWRERPERVVLHYLGGWRVDPWLHDLVFAAGVVVPCAQLLGVRRLRLFHDQVFHKPPRHPGVVPWHQDYSYWTRTAPARHVTINVLLDDADEESGCLEFVPGSHRWPTLPKVPFDAPREAVFAHLDEEQRTSWSVVAAPGRAGEATIHHSHTLHGSGPNRSARPRRAVVLNYMDARVRYVDASQPLLQGVPPLAPGEVVRGSCFPVVLEWDPRAFR